MRKLAYIFGIALFLFGCGGKQFLHIGYDPTDSIQPFFKLGGKQPVLYIDPVIDNRKNAEGGIIVGVTVWKSGKFQDDPRLIYTWTSALLQTWLYHTSKTPQEIIRDSLETQVRRLGIKVTQDQSKADGTLKASIEKFYYPPTITGSEILVAIDLNLYKTGLDSPIWSSKLKGVPGVSGTTLSTVTKFDGEKGLNRALINAMKKWQNRYDFHEAMANLSGINFPQSSPQPVVQQPSVKQQVVSGGTGFIFSSRDYIITNYHVVKGAGSIEVKFPDGEVIKAKVLAKDSQNDIAVLKLSQSPSTQIPDLNFGDSSKVRPGDKVFTIGYPASSILGKNQKITDGIVSSITGIEDDPTMFQITVPIQPGNSGGPLFNESGEVIGITTASLSLNAIRSLGAVPQNVNYAIKSSFVNNLLTTIPKTLLSNRGIVVIPSKPGNSLADFFERVSNNIVLIEAKD